MFRRTLDRVYAAAILAGLLALVALILAASVGAARSAGSQPPRPAATVAVAGSDSCEEDEPCWDCHTMGNRVCGADVPPECQGAGDVLALCVRVASRPPFQWLGPDGQIEGDLPDGRTLLRDLWVGPGDPEFAEFVAAYDADWRRVHP
ncbi:hypothetical protein OHS33_39165 (plasmid) [Streptomyces sp. NBC_00536]|uniref:hypothetical protein n=1 Tax=Streptomyces sp. NBC_00536 TaxID=2975769 RepID=UPI002E82443C|nr:hypothetical protein [Streptomyces sp. NBC_00536]WUC84380.1 hypothetical protein OHS33_39165 [Streptomyces sp. NBC_00536]